MVKSGSPLHVASRQDLTRQQDLTREQQLPGQQDPTGPTEGEFYVIRGASWMHGSVTELRLSFRNYGNKARPDVGFRIARYLE